jgi:hypothetical protein
MVGDIGHRGAGSGVLRRLARWRRLSGDERGVEVVEWIGVGAILVMMVVGVHLSLYGAAGAKIRAALTGAVARTAAGFGHDVVVGGPGLPRVRVPQVPGAPDVAAPQTPLAPDTAAPQVEAPDVPGLAVTFGAASSAGSLVPPNVGPPATAAPGARPLIDLASGSYTLLDMATGTRTIVGPAAGVQATFDANSGQLLLTDGARRLAARVDPQTGAATLFDAASGVPISTDLQALVLRGLVALRREAPSRALPISPVLGVPALFADGG